MKEMDNLAGLAFAGEVNQDDLDLIPSQLGSASPTRPITMMRRSGNESTTRWHDSITAE